MTDLYRLDDLLEPGERDVRDRVRAWCDAAVVPGAAAAWESAAFRRELIPGLAALGVCGGAARGDGCPGLSPIASGLVSMELARADGSLATFWAVQSGLVIRAIDELGDAGQRRTWLPRLASLEAIGAFALTEPNHGSDVVALETRARRDGSTWVLDGAKRWIGNATIADLVVVWARDEDGRVGGFLVEGGVPGLTVDEIHGKASQRAVPQADLSLVGVRVPLDARLAGSTGFRDVARVLMLARSGIAWSALGHALAGYEAALAYAGERHQFGVPLARQQLVQARLVAMLGDVTATQLYCLRLGQIEAAGGLTDAIASMAKLFAARRARAVLAEARDLLGGNGILLERHVARHQADLEGLYTYEGTDAIQTLVVGRAITGLAAFAPG